LLQVWELKLKDYDQCVANKIIDEWVANAYVVHPNMKSHTMIFMILGKGAIYTVSNKKIITKSYSEA